MSETVICLLGAGSLTAIQLIIFYKFFKFYSMENKEQIANNQIIRDLRAGRVKVFEYVRMVFLNEKVIAMVVDINDNNDMLLTILSGEGKGQKYWVASHKSMEVIPNDVAISELVRLKKEWKEEKRKQSQEASQIEFQSKYGNIGPGTYLRAKNALYIVDSVDMEDKMAKCVRLIDLGVGFPANQKCVLFLPNGFEIATPEEAAKILVKEYCNE